MCFADSAKKLWHVMCFLAFSLFFSAVCAHEQHNTAQDARPENNGILFSIEKSGKKSYILGTIHAGLSAQQSLGENILNVLSIVDDIYLEADISEEKRTGDIVDRYRGDPDGPGLRKVIGDEQFEKYFRFAVVQYPMFSASQFQSLNPWMLAMLLPVANRKGDQIGLLKWGTEAQLIDYAHVNKMPILEIEGLEHQFQVYSAMNEKQQRDYFNAYVSAVEQHDAYNNFVGDVKAWTDASYADLEDNWRSRKRRTDFYSSFHTSMVVERRSVYFSEKIAAAADSPKTHLFAVGEQHLAGTHSLIKNLQDQGFRVTLCLPLQKCVGNQHKTEKQEQKAGRN